MTVQSQIHNQFLAGVKNAVQSLENARAVYPPAYVDSVILPKHERVLDGLLAWRNDQLSRIGAFSVLPPRNSNEQTTTPPNITKAINTAYQAQLATINAQFTQQASALKQQLNAILKDVEAKLKQAKKVKDTSSIKQLNQAILAAKQSYQSSLKQIHAQQQQAIKNLAANITAQLNQAASGTVVLPPVSGGGSGGAPTATQYPIFDVNGNFVGYSTTPPSQQGGSFQPGGSQPVNVTVTTGGPMNDSMGGSQPQPGATNQPGTSIFDDLFSFLDGLFGGVAGAPAPVDTGSQAPGAPQSAAQAVVPYNQPSAGLPSDQLDIFDTDPWGGSRGGFGEFVTPMTGGNRVIRSLNRASIIPRSSFGYSQWASIISGVIQAAGSVGAAAATAELAPKPGKTTQVVAPPVAPAPAKTDYTPWILGGALVFGVGAFVISKRK